MAQRLDNLNVKTSVAIGTVGSTQPPYTLYVAGDGAVDQSLIVGRQSVAANTTNYEYSLRIQGKNNYSDGTTWYGQYGQIILHADSNMTSSARRFMITNALGNNRFAIVRSVDANTDPVVNSDTNGISSGTADFVIDNTGNIGIGQTVPLAKLQVGGGTSGTTNRSTVAILGGGSTGGILDALNLVNSATATYGNGTAINFNNAGNYTPTGRIIVQQVPSGTITDASMVFQVYQSGLKEALKLNPNQSVTFNESFTFPTGDGSSGQVLQTNGSGTVTWATVASGGGTVDGSGAANKVAYWSDADTLTSTTNFHFNGNALGIGTASPSYWLHVDNDAANTNNPALYVRNPNSSTSAVIARFVGDSDGIDIKNIGAGDYAIVNNQQDNGIYLYDGTGGVEIRYNGGTALEADSAGGIKVTGELSATADVIAYSSDERLKENIKPIENAVDKVKQMRGVTFDWNEKSEELGFEPTSKTNDVGVIAQEVEKVFPQLIAHAPFDRDTNEAGEVISKSGEDYKTVNYSRLTAVLIEAIKEQQEQIDTLKQEIANLKNK